MLCFALTSHWLDCMHDAQLLALTFCGSDSNSGARSTDKQVVSCALVLSE